MSTKKLVIILVVLLIFRLCLSLLYAYGVNLNDGVSSNDGGIVLIEDKTADAALVEEVSEETATTVEDSNSQATTITSGNEFSSGEANTYHFATPLYSELPIVRRYSYENDEPYNESIVKQFNGDVNDYFNCINSSECEVSSLEAVASSFLSYEDYYKNYDKYITKEINLLGSEILNLVEAINKQDVKSIDIILDNINLMIQNISKEINNEENLS